MPDGDDETGRSSRLLRGLIWAGVLLAPLAAAVVLLGQSSGAVRFAVLLIAVSVVLIGASVLIRNDPVLQRMHVEDRVSEEIEGLRRDLRAEFGRGASGAPQSDNSGFFRDAGRPADDPFPAAPRRMPDPGFASGGRAAVPAPAPAAAAVAVAAVRPPGPGPHAGPGFGPGPHLGSDPEFDEPSFGGRREPGMTSGPRPVAASASIPAPRGAAAVPAPSSPAVQRASASVRPGGGQYGRTGSPGADFSGSNGYAAARVGGTYGSPRVVPPAPNGFGDGSAANGYGGRPGDGQAQPNGIYGAPNGHEPSNGYEPPDDGYESPNGYESSDGFAPSNGYDSPNGYQSPNGYDQSNHYEPSNGYDPSNDYAPVNEYGSANGYHDDGYGDYSHLDHDVAGYGLGGGYDGPQAPGDPAYKARRHRPSANDTNVGTLADFAAYPGWSDEPQPDERYVQGYGPRRR
ncbi:hypothetical protein [Actinoplanes subtropicus]|uniref:hypothetical protein n=1 Tax=Actinoplanes subtropicus TaxID=543632 RepID=UPI0004C2CEDB|nr:hypothetical protein [Actinoplanes subtropicus]